MSEQRRDKNFFITGNPGQNQRPQQKITTAAMKESTGMKVTSPTIYFYKDST